MGMSQLTVSVFSAGETGGNPCTHVQSRRSGEEMIALARSKGHECCLALPTSAGSYALRFFAPSGEMEMCAHASAGAAWVLCDGDGTVTEFMSAGGPVRAFKSATGEVSISQPAGRVEPCAPEGALRALGLSRADLGHAQSVVNAASTRVKTLIPLASIARLQSLDPEGDDVRVACELLGSTGLYPWARSGADQIEARQFPRAAGYREDPATGVAAAALFFALGAPGQGLTIHQGRAMRRLSRITVSRDPFGDGCILTGRVRVISKNEIASMANA
jgi:trans-2,3-dihydro-3-hydroxyanthranilate isomerase